MAVFIALIFQLLFIFFAMVINVGLLVHDKINLQNSVDLAAYYAAGKQAEVLDGIAHSNYQIRQSWKLLSWRIRALGDMGAKGHPMLNTPPPGTQDTNAAQTARDEKINDDFPALCLKHSWWSVSGGEENYCRNKIGNADAQFPDPPIIIPGLVTVLPINVLLNTLLSKLQSNFNDACQGTGPINFMMAVRWMAAYRADIASRVRVIEQYRNNLSSSTSDFQDIEGDQVSQGAQKTLEKNLTASNRDTTLEFKMYNSLGAQTNWLNKIAVRPRVYYIDPEYKNNSCVVQATDCSSPPRYKNDATTKALAAICAGPQLPTDPMFSTVGYEKNPWVMAYVGVEATVSGRRPFAPFGGPVTLKARAFAKPFGGRIGPWFRSEWPQGSPGSSSGEFVDKMLPIALNTPQAPQDKNTAVPNYSRYPGDTLGLRSRLTLSQLRKTFLQSGTKKLSPEMWGALLGDFSGAGMVDPLAWETTGEPPQPIPPSQSYNGPWIRAFEIAAVVPDLFDVTYYSIEPQFYQTYVERASANAFNNAIKPRPDLGYHQGSPLYEKMNVFKQIQDYSVRYDPSTAYIIRDPNINTAVGRLLTAWAPQQVGSQFTYEFPDSVFGRCPAGFKQEGRGFPGGCGFGGRTGYSVKLISQDYLNDGEAAQGGGGNVGPILNPPPDSF